MDITTLALAKNLIKSTVGGGIRYEKISTLPEKGEKGVIYFLTRDDGSFSEYMYIDSAWELLGDSGEISLSWNDLTDKPFEDALGFEVSYWSDESGEIIFNIESKYIGANMYIDHSGDAKYESQLYSLTIGSTELSTPFFVVNKAPWELAIKSFNINENDVTYVFTVPSDFTGEVMFTVEENIKTLDDKFISENIARVEWVNEQIGDINSILATLSNGGVE